MGSLGTTFGSLNLENEEDRYIQEIAVLPPEFFPGRDPFFPSFVVCGVRGIGDDPSDLQVLSWDGRQYTDTTAEVFQGAPGNVFFPREAVVVVDFLGPGRSGIFVADHGLDAPPFPGSRNTLLLSTPDGHLTNASAQLPQDLGFWHDVSTGDIDGSGRQAIFVNNMNDKGTTSQLLMCDDMGQIVRCDDFLPAAVREFSGRYTSCALTDMTGDGKADLILGTADAKGGPSMLYLNPGNGDFSTVKPLTLPCSPLAEKKRNSSDVLQGAVILDISTIRLPGSEHNHLIVVSTNADYSLYAMQLLLNDGKGHFTDETEAYFGTQITGTGWIKRVHIADLKGDGTPAIVTQPCIGPDNPPAQIFQSDRNGHFHLERTIPKDKGSIYGVTLIGNQATLIISDGKNVMLEASDCPHLCQQTPNLKPM